MKRLIRVGTRKSKLAMEQTRLVIDRILKNYPEYQFETIGITTKGDQILDKSLDKIGGKGLFIKELETALLDGRIDMAVHSMKDMPAQIPEGLIIAACSEREDPRDVIVLRKNAAKISGAVRFGTGSTRRAVQLKNIYPNCSIEPLRGNIITRLIKLDEGRFDAIILASAGLKRLNLEHRANILFDVQEMVPAVGQGILAIECRKDFDYEFLTKSIHSEESEICVRAERSFLVELNGNCSIPIAAHAFIKDNKLMVLGFLASEDGEKCCRASIEGNAEEAEDLGRELANIVKHKLEVIP